MPHHTLLRCQFHGNQDATLLGRGEERSYHLSQVHSLPLSAGSRCNYLDDAWNLNVLLPEGRANMTTIRGTIDRIVKGTFASMKKKEMKKREQHMKRKVLAVVSNVNGNGSL